MDINFASTLRRCDVAFGIPIIDEYGDILSPQQNPGATPFPGARLLLMNSAQSYYPGVLWAKRMLPAAPTVLNSSSRTVQAQMCALGLGLAVLPCRLGDQSPALTRIDLGEAPPGRDIWMGYHQDMRRMDRLRALADLASELLTDEVGGS